MSGCSDPEVGKFLKGYHIGGVLREEDETRIEEHMLTCEFCWKEFQKLQREDPPEDKP